MAMDQAKITIIGAGVVGLAIAAEISRQHKDIVLLEKETSFGQGTSSRNYALRGASCSISIARRRISRTNVSARSLWRSIAAKSGS
jgi:glycine/D-amino acid oxidase-like deaminating enzyme